MQKFKKFNINQNITGRGQKKGETFTSIGKTSRARN